MAAGKDLINALKNLYMKGSGIEQPWCAREVARRFEEKREIVIEDCDPEILAFVVDYLIFIIHYPLFIIWTCEPVRGGTLSPGCIK